MVVVVVVVVAMAAVLALILVRGEFGGDGFGREHNGVRALGVGAAVASGEGLRAGG